MENEDIKFNSLELAIKANTGTTYNEAGNVVVDATKIVEAAKLFEAYVYSKEAE